ncbi:flagellar hook-basal body complex protein FliE [Silvibacterium acidisoli]|uniref:flagellar hook-basal body complex protein FliE n=1 Tax=Acidobacteriaceae bacterium ZG23-2 TaxID=2883246 RepID=UPI00406C7AA1
MQTSMIPAADLLTSAVSNLNTISGGASASEAPEMPFADLVKKSVDTEEKLEDDAAATVEGVMRGDGVDVHSAMIATQKANLAFEMALAVRNKAVSAYQQVMQMQF